MAIYSLAQRTSGTGSAAASIEFIAGATLRMKLLEIGITLNAATASALGFGRPAAIGVSPTKVVGLAEDVGDPAALGSGSLVWSTGPTSPANFFRKISITNVAGQGVVWTFYRGVIMQTAASSILWNLTTVSALDVWFVWDE